MMRSRRYRSLFANMLNGLAYCQMIFDEDKPQDFIYLEVNRAFESLTGLKDVVGKRASEAIPGIRESDPGLLEIYGRVSLTGQPEVFETYVAALKMWFSISVYSPQTGFFVAVFDVITKRKLAEEALQKSEARYRNTLDAMLEGCQIIGFDWKYLYLNDIADQHNRRPKEELLGKKYMDMWPGIESTWVFSVIKHSMEDRLPQTIETQFTFPDGGIGWFELRIYPVPEGIVILSVDITERKQAEEKISDLAKFPEENPHPIARIHSDGRISYGNKACAPLLKYWECQVGETIPADDYQIVRSVFEGRKTYENEIAIDGETFSILWVPIAGTNYVNAYGKDITQRKQAEEALRKSEQLYRAIGETIDYGVWVCAPDGRNMYASESFLKLVGLTQEQCSTFGWGDVLHPDDAERTIAAWKECIRLGCSWDIEHRFRGVDGQWHPILARGVPIKDEQGNILMWAGINLDISQLKKSEEALRRSEEQYRVLIEQAVDGIFISDKTGRYVSVNSKGLEMLGYSLEELLQKNLSDLVPAEDTGKFPLQLDDMRAGKQVLTERRMICKDGSLLPVEIHGKMLTDGRFQGIVHDITERKHAENALIRYSRRLAIINRLDHVISSSLDISTVYDAFVAEMKELVAFDRTSIILLDETCESWQIMRQWTQGKSAFISIQWYPLKGSAVSWVVQHRQAYLEGVLGEHAEWAEHAGLREEGLQSRVLLPLLIQGKVVGLLTLASRQPNVYQPGDLELLQTLADQLAIAVQNSRLYEQACLTAEDLEQRVMARTTQLEKTNKDLESFSYSVSHDLRAPLRAINGFSQILANRHRQSLDEEGLHYLDNVVEASNRMGILIDDLLRYSRVGRASVRLQVISLDDLFARILADLSPRINETGAVVELPPAGSTPQILSDMTILGQIFSNVINNALTYHKPEVPPFIQVTYKTEADYHLFGVADNGIGIPAEYREKIFEVFQRLHSAEDYPGTGIGLAIVKKSAELLGGRVWADSKEGIGSTFWIQIPKE